MKRTSSFAPLRLAALSPALLALAALAQTAPFSSTTVAPAPSGEPGSAPQLAQAMGGAKAQMPGDKPEQLLQRAPSGAGVAAPLSRADVIRELQRARAAGEMNWMDRETSNFMN